MAKSISHGFYTIVKIVYLDYTVHYCVKLYSIVLIVSYDWSWNDIADTSVIGCYVVQVIDLTFDLVFGLSIKSELCR